MLLMLTIDFLLILHDKKRVIVEVAEELDIRSVFMIPSSSIKAFAGQLRQLTHSTLRRDTSAS
jgi:hypothetical protein